MKKNPFELYSESSTLRVSKQKRATVIDVVSPQQEEQVTLRVPSSHFSIRALFIFLAVVCVVLFSYTFYLQIIKGQEYLAQAEGNRIHTSITKAVRGLIYDSDGELLLKNIPSFNISLDGQQLRQLHSEEIESIGSELSKITSLSQDSIDAQLQEARTSGQIVILQDSIEYEHALRLMIETQHLPGITIDTEYDREYLAGDAFSHVLGYIGKITEEEYAAISDSYQLNDSIGKVGLELFYEHTLKGVDGVQQIEVDYRGKQKQIISDTDPESGNSIHLSIDRGLQQYIYDTLKDEVESRGVPGAAVVALDPHTGKVLALVTYPSYDNNLFSGGISHEDYEQLMADERNPLFNRTISGEYASGSTFKPVVALAALEEGVIDRYTSVQSTGGVQIDQYFFPDWKQGGHGQTTVIKALAESVNTFFYLIGGGDNETTTGLGVKRITDYARICGLGASVGIDLSGEQEGFLPSKEWKEEWKDEAWYIGDTYHLSIGQGDILVTPLQVAAYTSIIANGGTFYQPHLVTAISNQHGDVVTSMEPVVIQDQVASASNISIVQAGLREAVLSGSARSLQALPFSSAGKTGTAQFGIEDKTHSWFTSYAPYESPEIVLTVLVEEAGEGSDVALPISRRILQQYFSSN